MQFEEKGKIGYNEVLQGITDSLEQENLSEEDRKILEQLKLVYENDMFKAQRKGDEVIQEEQRNTSSSQTTEKKHIPTEIAEGILDLRQGDVETTLSAFTSDKTQNQDKGLKEK